MFRAGRIGILGALATAAAVVPAAAHGATVRPAVTSLTASTMRVVAGGAAVTLNAHVRNASTCLFSEARGTKTVVSKRVACSSGAAAATLRSGANATSTAVTLRFSVRATGPAGSATRTVQVVQAATIQPLALLTTGALDPGIVNVSYSTSLLAMGGTGPYTWTIVAGALPDGLSLRPDGSISGTPLTSSDSTLTVQVVDAKGSTATATVTISITAPPTTSDTSTNWSGYAVNGGPFTAASGTFTVPTLVSTSPSAEVAEWVGIDGANNDDLIQAGVLESYNRRSGTVSAQAWWEILPDAATNISLPVQPGDTVTVTIDEVSTGQWLIHIVNDSTGQSFSITQSWSGAATSAEWIVEAPTSARGGQEVLGRYSPTVTFSQLQFSGVVTEIDQVLMSQEGVVVSTPSALATNGFNVAYGSDAPPAP